MPLPGPGLRLPSWPPSLLPPSSRSRCFHLHTQSGAFFLEGKSNHCPSPARSPSEATTVLRPVPPPRKRRFAGRLLSCARGVPSPFSGSPSPHTAVTGNSWGSFLLLPWHGCSRPWTPHLFPPISLSRMRPPLGRQHEGPPPPRASWASHSYPITARGPPPVITPFIMGCTSPPHSTPPTPGPGPGIGQLCTVKDSHGVPWWLSRLRIRIVTAVALVIAVTQV